MRPLKKKTSIDLLILSGIKYLAAEKMSWHSSDDHLKILTKDHASIIIFLRNTIIENLSQQLLKLRTSQHTSIRERHPNSSNHFVTVDFNNAQSRNAFFKLKTTELPKRNITCCSTAAMLKDGSRMWIMYQTAFKRNHLYPAPNSAMLLRQSPRTNTQQQLRKKKCCCQKNLYKKPCAGIIAAFHNSLKTRGTIPAFKRRKMHLRTINVRTLQYSTAEAANHYQEYHREKRHQNIMNIIPTPHTRADHRWRHTIESASGNRGTLWVASSSNTQGEQSEEAGGSAGAMEKKLRPVPPTEQIRASDQISQQKNIFFTDCPKSTDNIQGNTPKPFGGKSMFYNANRRIQLPRETAFAMGNPSQNAKWGNGCTFLQQLYPSFLYPFSAIPDNHPFKTMPDFYALNIVPYQGDPIPDTPTTIFLSGPVRDAKIRFHTDATMGNIVSTLLNHFSKTAHHLIQADGKDDHGFQVRNKIDIHKTIAGDVF